MSRCSGYNKMSHFTSILCILFFVSFTYFLIVVRSSPISNGEIVPVNDQVFTFAISFQLKEKTKNSSEIHFKHFCGGVLMQVHDCVAYVLSASHCFFHLNQSNVVAVFGAKTLQNYDGKRFSNLTIHSRPYNPYTYENDISLIKISLDEMCDKKLNPVRLVVDVNSTISSACYIYGYGSESLNGPPTLDLRIGQVQITPEDICVMKLGAYNAPKRTNGMFCAHGAKPNIDACGGDSGGGMLCMYNGTLAIVGITSYGLTCGQIGMPGVYTEVTHHIEFIASVLKNGTT